MKKTILTALMIGVLAAGSLGSYGTASAAGSTGFKDVPGSHWAASAIQTAVAAGYFKGYADGTFKPGAPVSKAEMAAILGRLSGQPVDASVSSRFTDLPAWAEEGVKAAVQKGFINPAAYSSGKLNANASLSRGELAVWLTNGLAKVNADYGTALKDVTNTVVPAKEYFTGKLPAALKNAVAVAMGTGLMSVGEDKQFGVDRTTTRAEVAVLLARYEAAAHKQPADFQGLRELREVGLTGTNLKVIAPRYVKVPEEKFYEGYDYSKVTDDFSKIRDKELVTVTGYATVKVKNWIIVNPYVRGDKRSIYYPVFVDEGSTLLHGAYYSFAEFDLTSKGSSLSQVQAGSLLNSVSFEASTSPKSKAFKEYSLPHTNDITKARGIFTVNNPHYWGDGLLHFDPSLTTYVKLSSKDGYDFWVRAKK
ncbi:hypothetical protein AWM70_21990 [Paenibacillus yonginensis]|uniref:SLH domain-containing protein n=1 Tax=Paenibacillus yonginensis TaxID=1462996 RepID=A0A1B1N651_9BACL|nr:S-layer homology domain-containing protein [Paenibacillus yonginensis]ANS76921.1 hypothetical protein AWM70_21990 [Paenibacillus yonginensis]